MANLTRAARAFTAEIIRPPADDKTPPPAPEPTAAEEGKQVLHHIHANYRTQMVPFKTAAAAALAAIYEQQQGPHIGALFLIPVLAYAAWVTTKFKLGWRPLGKGRYEYTDPSGRRAARIRRQARRAGLCFALIGAWLNLIALTGPVGLLNLPVWLAGALVWAVISDECWWRPARLAADLPRAARHDPRPDGDEPHDEPDDEPAVPMPVHRTRREPGSGRGRPARPVLAVPPDDLPVAKPPSLDVFERSPLGVTPAVEDLTGAIQDVIDENKVNARVLTDPLRGPRTTRYAIRPAPSQKPDALKRLTKAFEYACKGPVTIYDPIPGTGDFGVEVGRPDPDPVSLRELLTSPYARAEKHPLMVALGKDNEGTHVLVNLATLPHLLISGGTGGGKSVCLHCILNSLLARATPQEVRLVLIDPKKVELSAYANIPHLLMPIVTDANRAVNALEWLVDEMVARYERLAAAGVRNITEYNRRLAEKVARGEAADDPMYYIVCVIDELADLMMVAKKNTEAFIVRLVQLARASGIHLVIATQQPIVDVVTSLIKANMPTRLAFATASQSDSRVILDQNGAELLLGRGDSLYKPQGNKPVRVQGALVTEKEINAVVQHWLTQPRDNITMPAVDLDRIPEDQGSVHHEEEIGDDLDLLLQAIELVVTSQFGSTAMLQRKLRVGFVKAGRLMDLMEQRDIVGPADGSKARDVLITPDALADFLARIRLAAAYDDYENETSPNGRTPARVTVLAMMRRHADEDGLISRTRLGEVTQPLGIKEDNCNLALTQLRKYDPPVFTDEARGLYRMLPPAPSTSSPEES